MFKDLEELRRHFSAGEKVFSGGGDRIDYLKLTGGDNNLRFVYPLQGSPVVVYEGHTFYDPKFNFTLDLAWTFKAENYSGLCKVREEISQGLDAFEAIGSKDPMQSVAFDFFNASREAKEQEDEDTYKALKKKANLFFARTKALFLVYSYDNNKYMLLDQGKNLFDNVNAAIGVYGNVFGTDNGRDCVISGNGKSGKERRYTSPIFKDPSELTEEVPNMQLLNSVAYKYISPLDSVKAAMNIGEGAWTETSVDLETMRIDLEKLDANS